MSYVRHADNPAAAYAAAERRWAMRAHRVNGDDIVRTAGVRLRAAREHAGLTAAQAGTLINIAPATVTSYERGERWGHPALVARLCVVYGIAYASLFVEQEDAPCAAAG